MPSVLQLGLLEVHRSFHKKRNEFGSKQMIRNPILNFLINFTFQNSADTGEMNLMLNQNFIMSRHTTDVGTYARNKICVLEEILLEMSNEISKVHLTKLIIGSKS